MNSKLRRTSSVVVVLILVLAGALVQPFGPLPIPSFSALDSYARGGTLTEVVNAAAFLPGQVTPGLGVWSHTQANAYKAVWEVFILFDTPPAVPGFPFKRGVQRLMRDIEVHGDQMTFNANQGAGAPNAALSYKEECVPITSTRSEVAGDIVHAMQVQLTPKEQARLARSQRTNSEAYDLYLRALVHVGLENRQDNQAAVELLEQAVARDPKFAPAYAALGREYGTKAFIVDPKGKQWEEKALAAVENALSLDSELAEVPS